MDIPSWLTLGSTVSAALGTIGAAMYTRKAALVARDSLKFAVESQNDNIKPLLDFRRPLSAPPVGQNINVRGLQTNALYTFEISNIGQGSAILGDNPFRSPSITDVISGIHGGKPLKGKLVTIPEDEAFPNTLRPGEKITIKVAAGNIVDNPMGELFELTPMYYTDVLKREFTTIVTVRTKSGDVLSIDTRRSE